MVRLPREPLTFNLKLSINSIRDGRTHASRVRDCRGNPFVRVRTKDWNGKPDPEGNAQNNFLIVMRLLLRN